MSMIKRGNSDARATAISFTYICSGCGHSSRSSAMTTCPSCKAENSFVLEQNNKEPEDQCPNGICNLD